MISDDSYADGVLVSWVVLLTVVRVGLLGLFGLDKHDKPIRCDTPLDEVIGSVGIATEGVH